MAKGAEIALQAAHSVVDWGADVFPLVNVFYDLTNACNLSCRHCFISAGSPLADELKTDEALSLINTLASLSPSRVTFTGGEPLMRPDFLEVARHASSLRGRGIGYLKVTTNGCLVTPDLARQMGQLFDQVNVSIDGFRQSHDYLRGIGTFDRALAGLRNLVKSGADPKVSVTITSQNVQEIEAFLSFLHRKEGVRRFNCRPLWVAGRAVDVPDMVPDRSAVLRLLKVLGLSTLGSRERNTSGEHPDIVRNRGRCPAGYTMSLDPCGRLYPCVFMRSEKTLVAQFCNENIAEAYRSSSIYRRLRKRVSACVLSQSSPLGVTSDICTDRE